MNIPAASVRRPIFASMVTAIVVALGLVSFTRLRIDMLPEVELPTCTVRTEYEGASPEVVERLVTQIIEEIVATVPGVEDITSESSEGQSRVTVRFAFGVNLDQAAIELQSRLEQEIDELPEDIARPRVSKFDIASFPAVILGISSKLDPVALNEIVEDQVRFRFARIPGVAQVDVWGGYAREVRVELDPARINALGIPMTVILDSLRNANLDRPAGKLEDGRHEVTLRAPAEFESLGWSPSSSSTPGTSASPTSPGVCTGTRVRSVSSARSRSPPRSRRRPTRTRSRPRSASRASASSAPRAMR